jgi:nucleotide-binding universal stress UspA family protein
MVSGADPHDTGCMLTTTITPEHRTASPRPSPRADDPHDVLVGARPVIAAIEGTEVSRHALTAAEWLARETGTRLVAAHAFDAIGMPALPRDAMIARGVTDADLERADRAAATRMLARAATTVTSVDRTTVLLEGRPVPALLRLAADERAGVIVTGTAARGRLDTVLTGSVAAGLAASAPSPIVVVPPDAQLAAQGPIVVGYDGSEHAVRAARHAAVLADRMGREVVLVHVTVGAGARSPDDLPDVRVVTGEPADALAAYAAEVSAALLVTGIRGRGAVAAALLGSVSAGLVRAAGRPVMVVPDSAGARPVSDVSGPARDTVDASGDDSFPASDPPSWWAGR